MTTPDIAPIFRQVLHDTHEKLLEAVNAYPAHLDPIHPTHDNILTAVNYLLYLAANPEPDQLHGEFGEYTYNALTQLITPFTQTQTQLRDPSPRSTQTQTQTPIEAIDRAIIAITPKPDLSKEEVEVIDMLYALKYYLLSPENIHHYLPASAHHALSNLTIAMSSPHDTQITVDPTVTSQDDPLALDPDPITPMTGTISISSLPPSPPPVPSLAHVSQGETPSRLEEFLTGPFKKRKKS